MKKLYTLLLFVLIIPFTIHAQDVAQDFTETSCSGIEHHLYAELEAGNVIVLEFVMLSCSPCIVATNALEDILAPFEASNPGRVKLYSYGFLDDYTCDQMIAWCNSNSFTHEVFSKGEDELSYYGPMGMPTILVLGTANHKVFCEAVGYTTAIGAQVKTAIETALAESSLGIDEPLRDLDFSVYPTVFNDVLYLDLSNITEESVVNIYNSGGMQVMSSSVEPGSKHTFSTAELPNGIYFLNLHARELKPSSQFITQSIKLIKN